MGPRDERIGNTFLDSPQYLAMLRAVFPQATFLSNKRSVHIPVNLRSLSLISEVDALIDSGATDNFISPTVIKRFNIPTQILAKSLPIRNVDGTPNKIGAITQAVDLALRFKGTRTQTFYVIDLGDDHMLLGMPFLKATNPNIDWTNGTCEGKIEASTPEAHYKPLANHAVEATQMKEELQEANYSSKYTNLESEEQSIV